MKLYELRDVAEHLCCINHERNDVKIALSRPSKYQKAMADIVTLSPGYTEKESGICIIGTNEPLVPARIERDNPAMILVKESRYEGNISTKRECPTCYHEVSSGDNYCKYCGQRLSGEIRICSGDKENDYEFGVSTKRKEV